jgi:hypothetical protein
MSRQKGDTATPNFWGKRDLSVLLTAAIVITPSMIAITSPVTGSISRQSLAGPCEPSDRLKCLCPGKFGALMKA